MIWPWLAVAAAVLLLLVFLAVMWRVGAAAGDPRRALEQFSRHRDELRAAFFLSASSSGKPRGLVWKSLEWHDGVTLVRERDTRRLAVLVGVTIAFEAVAGGEMEGVAAVGNLRQGSAAFFYHRGVWQTTGKAIFNLLPDEAVARLTEYERVSVGKASALDPPG